MREPKQAPVFPAIAVMEAGVGELQRALGIKLFSVVALERMASLRGFWGRKSVVVVALLQVFPGPETTPRVTVALVGQMERGTVETATKALF
ncbi:MAG: hypothetical protein V7760_09210 [Marinobacter sp.]